MRFEWEKTEIKGSSGICITGCNAESERLTIPEEEDGLPVHEIGNHAFASRKTPHLSIITTDLLFGGTILIIDR